MRNISKMFYNKEERVGENVNRNESQNSSLNLSNLSGLTENLEAIINNGDNLSENMNFSDLRSDVDLSVDDGKVRPQRNLSKTPNYSQVKVSDEEDLSGGSDCDNNYVPSQEKVSDSDGSDVGNPYVPRSGLKLQNPGANEEFQSSTPISKRKAGRPPGAKNKQAKKHKLNKKNVSEANNENARAVDDMENIPSQELIEVFKEGNLDKSGCISPVKKRSDRKVKKKL